MKKMIVLLVVLMSTNVVAGQLDMNTRYQLRQDFINRSQKAAFVNSKDVENEFTLDCFYIEEENPDVKLPCELQDNLSVEELLVE